MSKNIEDLSPAEVYKKVYTGEICDMEKSIQMQTVLNYFTQRGYNIRRVLNPVTEQQTFYWYLTWE